MENNWFGPTCPKPHSTCCGHQQTLLKGISTIFSAIKYFKYAINNVYVFYDTKYLDLIEQLTRLMRVKDQIAHSSDSVFKMASQQDRLWHIFRSNFWLAHRTMLKFGRKVQDRGLGQTSLKKVFMSRFSLFFRQSLNIDQSEIPRFNWN